MLNLLSDKSGYKDGNAGFYDMNAGLTHRVNERSQLALNGYYSRDRFSLTGEEKYSYRNANASLKWRQRLGDKLTATLSGGYDYYGYLMKSGYNPAEAFNLEFTINQSFAGLDFVSYLSDRHTLDFGIGAIRYSLMPGACLPASPESLVIPDRIQTENALETSAYLSDLWDITPALSVHIGLRYTLFNALASHTTRQAPDFRLSMRYTIRPDLSFKAGVNTLQQNIHKLSNTTIMSPTDTWKLSDAHIRPQKGMQAAAGLYRNFLDNTIEASIEGYYKSIQDYLDYRGGAQLMMNHHLETDVFSAGGKAYGVELMLKKATGKLTGWVGYSYSRSLLRQDDPAVDEPVNNGNWYPADYDKPHEFKFAGNYKFTQRYSLSLNCDYSTGRPVTLPAAKYDYMEGEYVYYSERNQYRIPDFFRMDMAFNIEPTHHLTVLTHSTISLGVYNVTGRKNAYSVYYIAESGRLNGYMMAIFGAPIPYLSYNIRF
ncbi:MAG: TonB-dependent receptor [Tannerellaceae bacterium]|nr:TonB-dependent receptor [Tannerellaceae bacterium]